MGCPDNVREGHCLGVWGGLKRRKSLGERKDNLFVKSFLSIGMNIINLANEVLIPRRVQHSFFLHFFISQVTVTEKANN